MQTLQTKQIILRYDQANFLAVTIKRAELVMDRFNPTHETLDKKVKALQRLLRMGIKDPALILDSQELKLAREYNLDYCFVLADSFGAGVFVDAEVIEIYRLATKVQLLITSRY